jgi:hypothetical protein
MMESIFNGGEPWKEENLLRLAINKGIAAFCKWGVSMRVEEVLKVS